MADYYPLIAKAVTGLEKNTGEARRTLYERARNALVAQLRSVTPALSESDITRERLALEEAIRKVEADAARRARAGTMVGKPDQPPVPTPAPRPPEPAAPPRTGPSGRDTSAAGEGEAKPPDELPTAGAAPRPPIRRREFDDTGSLRDQGLKGFRDVVAEAESLGEATVQASKSAREAFAAATPTRDAPRMEPHMEPEGLRPPSRRSPPRATPALREPPPSREGPALRKGEPPLLREPARAEHVRAPGSRDRAAPWPGEAAEPGPGEQGDGGFTPRDKGRPPFGGRDDDALAGRERPLPFRRDDAQARGDTEEEGRGALSGLLSNRLALIVVVLVLVFLGLSGLVYWQWPTISGLLGSSEVARTPSEPVTGPTSRKLVDRIGAPAAPDSRPQEGANVAQRVVLYEEDPANPSGKRYVGTAVWRLESIVSAPGQAADVAVRADIEIPEPQITVKWSLRRNTDKALPASHTIEIVFSLPPNFPNGSIANIPGILMKQAEQTRGVPLAGLAVKVTAGFFLIGLSSSETDVKRNIELLKERAWFDVPVVYTNGRRAIMAIEKGTPGDRAFAEAFAAWGE